MNANLWTCPDCAFSFSADHANTDGSGYSCPVCENVRLAAANQELKAAATATVEAYWGASSERLAEAVGSLARIVNWTP